MCVFSSNRKLSHNTFVPAFFPVAIIQKKKKEAQLQWQMFFAESTVLLPFLDSKRFEKFQDRSSLYIL